MGSLLEHPVTPPLLIATPRQGGLVAASAL